MNETTFVELRCQKCGGKLSQSGDVYVCSSCGKQWEKQVLNTYEDIISACEEVVKRQRLEDLSNLRVSLWEEINKEFISNKEVARICNKILEYKRDDFYASFYLATCSKENDALAKFLNKVDVELFVDDVKDILDYTLKALRSEWILPIGNFIDRAYKQQNLIGYYNDYRTRFEKIVDEIEQGMYEPTLPRDVFVAYSSKDMAEVENLVQCLENEGYSCFVASRNLRHGSGSVENYEEALRQAIINCGAVVFVSSTNSRNLKCDAYREITYVKNNHPDKLRVEYLIENYVGRPIEKQFTEFFKGKEYCTSPLDVFDRLTKLFAENVGKQESENNQLMNELKEQTQSLSKQIESLKNSSKNQTQIINNTDNSNNVSSLLTRAEQELEMNKLNSAREYYSKILDFAPECYEAWFGLAITDYGYASVESLEKGLKDLSNVTDGSPFFTLKYNDNVKQCLKYADKGGKKVIDNLFEFIDNTLENLKIKPDNRLKDFYLKVIDSNLSEEFKYYARLNTFLTTAGYNSIEEIIEKVNTFSDGSVGSQANEEEVNKDFESFSNIKLAFMDGVKSFGIYNTKFEEIAQKLDVLKTLIQSKNSNYLKYYDNASRTFETSVNKAKNELKILSDKVERNGLAVMNEPKKPSADMFWGLLAFIIPAAIYTGTNGILGTLIVLGIAFVAFLIMLIVFKNKKKSYENALYYYERRNEEHQELLKKKSELTSALSFENNKLLPYKMKLDLLNNDEKTLKEISSQNLKNSNVSADDVKKSSLAMQGLKSEVNVPNDFTKIYDSIFKGNEIITEVKMGDNVTAIEDFAFDGCKKLTKIKLSKNLKTIGMFAFRQCTSLEKIDLPKGLTTIGQFAFRKCPLKEIRIPEGVTTIDEGAFGCDTLETIYIPNTVKTVKYPFFSRRPLTIYFDGTKDEWDNIVWLNKENSRIYPGSISFSSEGATYVFKK